MRTLGPGDRGDLVGFAQQRLRSLGFGPKRVTGVYGEPTEAAVRAFRAARLLPAGATLDDAAWDELLLAQAQAAPVSFAEAEAPVGEALPLPELGSGARGEAVRLLQEALNALGQGPLALTSAMDPPTRAAVAAHQAASGMPADGVMGEEDWLALFARLSSVEALNSLIPALSDAAELLDFSNGRWREVDGSGGYRYRQFEDGSIRVVTDPRGRLTGVTLSSGSAWAAISREIGPFPAAAAPPPPSTPPATARPTTRRGDRNEHTRAAQVRLNGLGFGPLEEDGVFGAGTDQAVRRFQELAGVGGGGVIDPATWAALEAVRGPVRAGSPPEEVRRVQDKLNLLGLGPLTVDGQYGARSAAAVRVFQTQQGLPATGEVDERCWWRLLGARTAAVPAAATTDAQTALRQAALAAASTLPEAVRAKALAVLDQAIAVLGAAESPPGSNAGPLIDPISSGYYTPEVEKQLGRPPWCALAVSHWIRTGLGLSSWPETPMKQRFGAVAQYQDWGKSQGRWLEATASAPPGSVFIMPRATSGSDTSSSTRAGHTGLVVRDLGDRVETIEGNVSDSVRSRTRKKSDLFGFVTWW